MNGFTTIFRRELAGLFLSPLAWILFCLAIFYNAYFFVSVLGDESGGEVNAALALLLGGGWPFWMLNALLAPLITMRMISEESRSGLLEFLLTAPVSDAAVVAGKALAASTFLALVWAFVPVCGVAVQLLGAPPDWGMLLVAWCGAVLVSALFVSIGLVCSAASGTPLVAAFLAMVVNVVLVFVPILGRRADGRAADVVGWLTEKVDVMAHYQGSFQTGALDSAHVAFFCAWILALLFLAVRLLEARRWL